MEEKYSKLHEDIISIVNENLGGIKFIDLVSDLVVLSCEDPSRYNSKDLVNDIEKVCRTSNVVKVLDYANKFLNRSKMFVYTE